MNPVKNQWRTTTSDILQSSIDTDTSTAGLSITLTGDFDKLKNISNSTEDIKIIGDSVGLTFTVLPPPPLGMQIWRIKADATGNRLLRLISARAWMLPHEHPNFSFPPEIKLLRRAIRKSGIQELIKSDLTAPNSESIHSLCASLNSAVELIRFVFQKPSFKNKKLSAVGLAKVNLESGLAWLENIFDRYKRLCVIRIDLSYLKQYQWQSGDLHAVTSKEIFMQREEFARMLPHFFEKNAFLDYAIRTEYTLRKSLHHHALIILDGSKARQHEYLCTQLGKEWERITNGRGWYHNVNMHTDQSSPTCGIGEVSLDDAQKVHNLKYNVFSYLIKNDYLVRFTGLSNKQHFFIRSTNVKPPGVKQGRPRKFSTSTVPATAA